VRNILIINLARFGDIVQTIPMVEGLSRKYPDSKITMLVNSSFINVCNVIPGIYKAVGLDFRMIYDQIFSDRSCVENGYSYLIKIFDDLRLDRFDKIINITPHDIGVITTFLSGDEKAFWTNINDWSKYYFNITKNWDTLTLNVVDMFKRIAGVSRQKCFRNIRIDDRSIYDADNLLKNLGVTKDCCLIGLQPGASTDDKKWPIGYFIELADIIIKGLNAKIILFGGESDTGDGKEIEDKLQGNVINMIGKTDISQLCALMSKTDILITNDTGPMHIGAFAGAKVVSINMGKELCETTGPYGDGNVSFQPKIACYPCLKPELCQDKICRNVVKPDFVFNIIKYLNDNFHHLLPDSRNEDVDVYISRFDDCGTIDFLPLFKTNLDLRTFNRKILRKIWDLSLSDEFNDLNVDTAAADLKHHFEKYFYTGGFYEHAVDSLEKRPILSEIVQLSDNGLSLSTQICECSKDVTSNIKKIGFFSKQLEQINENIFRKGEGLGEPKVIIAMFEFEIDSLNGKNIAEMSEETCLIYSNLISRLNLLIKFIDYYIEIKSLTYNEKKTA